MVPADSHRIARVPWYLGYSFESECFCLRGYHPLWPDFPVRSTNTLGPTLRSHNPDRNCFLPVWADPRSLATTRGVSVDVSSTRYLDVSVPWVRFSAPMNSVRDDRVLARPGFPIRRSTDQSSLSSSPWLIAARYVLHRLLPPRHSPHALISLTKTVFRQSLSRGLRENRFA